MSRGEVSFVMKVLIVFVLSAAVLVVLAGILDIGVGDLEAFGLKNTDISTGAID